MRGDYIFASAQRDWENPPELEEVKEELPDTGVCPHCRKDLAWDGVDDTIAWCATPRCKYDNGISEEANRILWSLENDRLGHDR